MDAPIFPGQRSLREVIEDTGKLSDAIAADTLEVVRSASAPRQIRRVDGQKSAFAEELHRLAPKAHTSTAESGLALRSNVRIVDGSSILHEFPHQRKLDRLRLDSGDPNAELTYGFLFAHIRDTLFSHASHCDLLVVIFDAETPVLLKNPVSFGRNAGITPQPVLSPPSDDDQLVAWKEVLAHRASRPNIVRAAVRYVRENWVLSRDMAIAFVGHKAVPEMIGSSNQRIFVGDVPELAVPIGEADPGAVRIAMQFAPGSALLVSSDTDWIILATLAYSQMRFAENLDGTTNVPWRDIPEDWVSPETAGPPASVDDSRRSSSMEVRAALGKARYNPLSAYADDVDAIYAAMAGFNLRIALPRSKNKCRGCDTQICAHGTKVFECPSCRSMESPSKTCKHKKEDRYHSSFHYIFRVPLLAAAFADTTLNLAGPVKTWFVQIAAIYAFCGDYASWYGGLSSPTILVRYLLSHSDFIGCIVSEERPGLYVLHRGNFDRLIRLAYDRVWNGSTPFSGRLPEYGSMHRALLARSGKRKTGVPPPLTAHHAHMARGNLAFAFLQTWFRPSVPHPSFNGWGESTRGYAVVAEREEQLRAAGKGRINTNPFPGNVLAIPDDGLRVCFLGPMDPMMAVMTAELGPL